MSSKNSNNSDIEVIGPEDLEDSPPPQDSQEEAGESGDKESEVTSGAGDQEGDQEKENKTHQLSVRSEEN